MAKFAKGQNVRVVDDYPINDYKRDGLYVFDVREDGKYIVAIGYDDDVFDVFDESDLLPLDDDLRCKHGVAYPAEGPNGPWSCNPDGSNPNCDDCEPDAWKRETTAH